MAIRIASKHVSEDGRSVAIDFSNGKQVSVQVQDLPADMLARLALHGLSQKLGDSYSGCAGDLTQAVAECEATAEALLAGNWNRRGDGFGGADLAQALANVQGKMLEEAQEAIAGLGKDDREGLRKHPKIKAEMARIKADRLDKKAEGNSPDLGGLFT
jgi:glutathione S-transferase